MMHTEEINGLRRKELWLAFGVIVSFILMLFTGGAAIVNIVFLNLAISLVSGLLWLFFFNIMEWMMEMSVKTSARMEELEKPLIERLIDRLQDTDSLSHTGLYQAVNSFMERVESDSLVTQKIMDEVLIDLVPTFEHLLSLDYGKANDKLYGTIEQVFVELTEVVDLRVEKAQEAKEKEKEAFSAMASDQLGIDLDQIRLYKQRTMETL